MARMLRAPLNGISRMSVYINESWQDLPAIVAAEQPDLAFTGTFYVSQKKAACHLKADGYIWAEDPTYSAYGYAWNQGPDLSMVLLPEAGEAWKNYVTCCQLIKDRKPLPKLYYNADVGGRRGRVAMGVMAGALCVWASLDGTPDVKSPEELRDYLFAQGWESAVMMDGGGKVNLYHGGEFTMGGAKSQNLILVWLKKEGGQTPPKEETMGTYKVTATVGLNIRTDPDKNAGKVGAYPLGAIVAVLETRDSWGRTDKGWVTMAYLEPVQAEADRTLDSGITIRRDYIPHGRANRPGKVNPDTYITIHETGNFAAGADAAAHAVYLKGDSAAQGKVSWHYTVDDHAVVQHLPDGETAYHAGDGAGGPGNAISIGIEICVNQGGDFEKSKRNAAALVRMLMKEHGIPLDRMVQHNHWNGKDCPKTIRATKGAWEAFLGLCGGQDAEDKLWYSEARKWAMGLGITDGERPDDTSTRAELWVTLYRLARATREGSV